jgi:hypothetical protein
LANRYRLAPATYPNSDPKIDHAPFLFGLAPGGVYHAIDVTANAVRSYRTLSPLPCKQGGLLSAALSLGLLRPDVIRRRISVEPGLSSPPKKRDRLTL